MRLVLTKKPKGVTIIEGFPGFGLIGTIASEFLVEHLKTEKIGSIEMDDIPAVIAIHQKKVIEPVCIDYNKKHNLVIVHAINIGHEHGWQLARTIGELARELNAKEIVSLEGVGTTKPEDSQVYYFTTDQKKEKELNTIAKSLSEGIIVGVTGALLTLEKKVPVTALFAETHSNLPDSKAAAMIIKALDQHLGLKVDYKPLIKQAEEFEHKLREIFEQTREAEELREKKKLSYVG